MTSPDTAFVSTKTNSHVQSARRGPVRMREVIRLVLLHDFALHHFAKKQSAK
jgi:hypothetical protein